jgi:hypothetical protein
MTTTTTKTKSGKQLVKLVCPECQRQNEPERIYCHDCGARLDRSSLTKVAPKQEAPEQTQKRLKRLLDPTRAKIRHIFFQTSKILLGSCAMAGLIEMVLPPDVPDRTKNPGLSMISMDIENALATHSTIPLQYNETQVNGYLASTLRNKKAALNNTVLQFERAVVKFDEGLCRITVERSLFGFSLFTTVSYNVALHNGKLTAANTGGKIGRLPVHPKLMEYGGMLYGDLFTALDRERKLVGKMGAIEFHPEQVVLTPIQKE